MIQKIKQWWAKDLTGIDRIAEKLKVNPVDVFFLRRDYGLPMTKNDVSVWQIDKKALKTWAREYQDIILKVRRGLADVYGQAGNGKKSTFQKEKRW